jgi:hypothetical protein
MLIGDGRQVRRLAGIDCGSPPSCRSATRRIRTSPANEAKRLERQGLGRLNHQCPCRLSRLLPVFEHGTGRGGAPPARRGQTCRDGWRRSSVAGVVHDSPRLQGITLKPEVIQPTALGHQKWPPFVQTWPTRAIETPKPKKLGHFALIDTVERKCELTHVAPRRGAVGQIRSCFLRAR